MKLMNNFINGSKNLLPIIPLIFLFSIIQMLFMGYYFGIDDHAREIPFIKKYLNSSLYPNDIMIATQSKYFTFHTHICALLTAITHNMEIVFFSLQVLAYFLVNVLVYHIALYLFNNKTSAIMSLALMFPKKLVLGGSAIHFTSYVPSFAILPAILLAIYLFLKKRYIIAFVILGLCFNCHALVSLYTFAMFAFYSVFNLKQIGIKRLAISIGLCLLCASPVLIAMFKASSSIADEWISLMRIRSSQHCFPFSWNKTVWINYLMFMALTSFSLLVSKRDSIKILYFLGAIVIMCAIGVIFTEFIPIKSVIKAQFFRSTNFMTIFMLLYSADYFRKSWSVSYLHKIAMAMGFAVLLFLSDYYYYTAPLAMILILIAEWYSRKGSGVTWQIMAVTLFVSSALIIRILFIHDFFPESFDFGAIIDFTKSLFQNHWKVFIRTLPENHWAIISIITASLYYIIIYKIIPYMKKSEKNEILLSNFSIAFVAVFMLLVITPGVFRHFHPPDRYSSSWYDAQFWAKDNTQLSDMFITPPYMDGFRIFSERPIVGDWDDGTQQFFDSEFGSVWWVRMNELGLDRDYDNLSLEKLKAIAKKYNAKYLIVSVSRNLDMKLVHENSDYRIYEPVDYSMSPSVSCGEKTE